MTDSILSGDGGLCLGLAAWSDFPVVASQELNFPAEKIHFSEALEEVAQGEWEGRLRKEVYTPQVREVISSMQLDFHAPGGESQRQAEFRMVEFLTTVVLPRAERDTQLVSHLSEHDELQVFFVGLRRLFALKCFAMAVWNDLMKAMPRCLRLR